MYFLHIFSPETYEIFTRSDMNISGFRLRHRNAAEKIGVGNRLICYMTKLSRWCGILEVKSPSYEDYSPLYYDENDPYVIRFEVQPLVWLKKECAIPIREDRIWNTLSFTKDHDRSSSHWTGKLRTSLVQLADSDG